LTARKSALFPFSKVIIPHDDYPRTEKLFVWAVTDREGKTLCILPLKTETIDQRIISRFGSVFLRGVETDAEERLIRTHLKEIENTIHAVNKEFGIPPNFVPNFEIILDGRVQGTFRAFAFSRKERSDEFHHMLFFGKQRIEVAQTRRNRLRLFRHEYLHILDHVLGEGGFPLTETKEAEILGLLERHVLRKPITREEDGTFPFEAREAISTHFMEGLFFAKEKGYIGGHPKDGTDELFASALTCYLDPAFRNTLRERTVKEQKAIAGFMDEITQLVEEAIKKRLSE
jgi:hypothetical protein